VSVVANVLVLRGWRGSAGTIEACDGQESA